MNKDKYRVVFMGTPEIGVPSLKALIDDEVFDVVGVFTNPDRPVGRKQEITPPPVKIVAEKNDIPVFQPEKFDERANEQLRTLEVDIAVVIAYGQILREETLLIPENGIVNVHYSLLPKYRGAIPVQAAIIDGETISGITVQRMALGLDEGDILSQTEYLIEENETSGEVLEKMSTGGVPQLIDTLKRFLAGEIEPEPQDHFKATYCKQSDIGKEKAQINWEKSAKEIHNLIRGMNPWPIAWTTLDGKRVKIFRTTVAGCCNVVSEKPGTVVVEGDKMFVVCGHGILEVVEIQMEGKQKVEAKEFVKGLQEKVIFE